mmetsp:Transcript_138797/g.442695  ORF Transcript_138797/g.442695 Transcript_138797/m.442695 type:complete len:117 (-) Transcript_138797:83-433(-)
MWTRCSTIVLAGVVSVLEAAATATAPFRCLAPPTSTTMSGAAQVDLVPPHNSIDHLHLHCLMPPFDNVFYQLKYSPRGWWCTSYGEVHAKLSADVAAGGARLTKGSSDRDPLASKL